MNEERPKNSRAIRISKARTRKDKVKEVEEGKNKVQEVDVDKRFGELVLTAQQLEAKKPLDKKKKLKAVLSLFMDVDNFKKYIPSNFSLPTFKEKTLGYTT